MREDVLVELHPVIKFFDNLGGAGLKLDQDIGAVFVLLDLVSQAAFAPIFYIEDPTAEIADLFSDRLD